MVQTTAPHAPLPTPLMQECAIPVTLPTVFNVTRIMYAPPASTTITIPPFQMDRPAYFA